MFKFRISFLRGSLIVCVYARVCVHAWATFPGGGTFFLLMVLNWCLILFHVDRECCFYSLDYWGLLCGLKCHFCEYSVCTGKGYVFSANGIQSLLYIYEIYLIDYVICVFYILINVLLSLFSWIERDVLKSPNYCVFVCFSSHLYTFCFIQFVK